MFLGQSSEHDLWWECHKEATLRKLAFKMEAKNQNELKSNDELPQCDTSLKNREKRIRKIKFSGQTPIIRLVKLEYLPKIPPNRGIPLENYLIELK